MKDGTRDLKHEGRPGTSPRIRFLAIASLLMSVLGFFSPILCHFIEALFIRELPLRRFLIRRYWYGIEELEKSLEFVAPGLWIVGLLLGTMALVRIAQSGGKLRGRYLAYLGIALSLIGFLDWLSSSPSV